MLVPDMLRGSRVVVGCCGGGTASAVLASVEGRGRNPCEAWYPSVDMRFIFSPAATVALREDTGGRVAVAVVEAFICVMAGAGRVVVVADRLDPANGFSTRDSGRDGLLLPP